MPTRRVLNAWLKGKRGQVLIKQGVQICDLLSCFLTNRGHMRPKTSGEVDAFGRLKQVLNTCGYRKSLVMKGSAPTTFI